LYHGSKEIRTPSFFPIDEFEPEEIKLFPPFAESLKFLSKPFVGKRSDADEQWITVNGAHIPIDGDGKLSGSVGEKIASSYVSPENITTTTWQWRETAIQ
jgi:hypothetical protein